MRETKRERERERRKKILRIDTSARLLLELSSVLDYVYQLAAEIPLLKFQHPDLLCTESARAELGGLRARATGPS